MPIARDHARQMRGALTPAEAVLWTILRSPPLDQWHFRRQVVFANRYIADFASHAAKLVVEADGPSHDLTALADAERTAWFEGAGYRVIRFRNADIFADRQAVWREVNAFAVQAVPPPRSAKTPSRPPLKGEGV